MPPNNPHRPEPQHPDLILPMSLFQDVVRYSDLVMVLPYYTSEGWFADYLRIVKVSTVLDRDFFAWQEEGVKPEQFQGHVFYDVQSIRECRARDVTVREWYKNLGPGDLRSWCRHRKAAPGTPVRVYHLNKITYDLRQFNRDYRLGFQ